jgi:alpha-tubulin suppressor-like RCC1 family protein
VELRGLGAATQVIAGSETTCARLEDQTVHCWGGNNGGVLGVGMADQRGSRTLPTALVGLSRIRAVDVLGNTACAVGMTGFTWCWGLLPHGSMYAGGAGNRLATRPELLGGIVGVANIHVGDNFVCLRFPTGSVECWGSNGSGQSGQQADPRPVTEPSTIVGALGSDSVALNGLNGCALMPNRQVHCWGAGYTHEANPVPDVNAVTSLTKYGEDGFCVSRVDFSVHCWTPGVNPSLNTGW